VVEQRYEIRILLVEDDTLVRLGLTLVLNAMTDLKVIGGAEFGRQAIEKTRELQPDIVLLDIGLPDISGLEALPQIKQQCPMTKVLMITSHEDLALSSMNAGADGLCKKSVSNDELYKAIQVVFSGQKWFEQS
jgi:DNA-binding NarL/FixJ family response regulator